MKITTATKNPFTWLEIYVEDMNRAREFYETILQIEMIPMETPTGFGDLEILCFPWVQGGGNASGSLCKTNLEKGTEQEVKFNYKRIKL